MRIVLIDDHRSFRESFRFALEREVGIEVVGEAGDARDGCELIERTRPDVALVDLLLAQTDGLSVLYELRRRRSPTRTLVLTMRDSELAVREALEAGAGGYAVKDQSVSEIVEAIRSVERGERYVSPRLAAAAHISEPSGLAALSKREREVLRCVVKGMSSREIARALFISVKTVETHRAHINRKLGTHSPVELVRVAGSHGLLADPA